MVGLNQRIKKLPNSIQGEKLLTERLLASEAWTGSTELSIALHMTRCYDVIVYPFIILP